MRLIQESPVRHAEKTVFVEAKFEFSSFADAKDLPIYELRDISEFLGKVRRSSIPESTLRHWRSKLGIEPDIDTGLYSQDDLDRLKYLVQRLKSGRFSIRQIAIQIQRGMYLNAS